MRALVAACTAGLVTASVAIGPARAQPASQLAQAKQLYDNATTEMTAGRYDDAARDFAAAYDITQDPVLFFKIGSAYEKAGHCDAATVYYKRYLAEANPEPHFVDLTNERIAACAANASVGRSGSGSGSGSASVSVSVSDSGSGSDSDSGSGSGSGSGIDAGSAMTSLPIGPSRIRGEDTPWLFVGGALAFVTLGAVLAYSASSSESDIRDLYQGVDNVPVTYDATTAQRYHDLVNEGHRYEYLSWASFGIAGAFGAAAAIYFVRDYREHAYSIVPTATPQGAGVSATIKF
jgi:hypothetical protein